MSLILSYLHLASIELSYFVCQQCLQRGTPNLVFLKVYVNTRNVSAISYMLNKFHEACSSRSYST
jgi:hypothetical protein